MDTSGALSAWEGQEGYGFRILLHAHARQKLVQNILGFLKEDWNVPALFLNLALCFSAGERAYHMRTKEEHCLGIISSISSLFFFSFFVGGRSPISFFLCCLILYILASQGEGHEPAASPRGLLDMQNFKPHLLPDLLSLNLHFNKEALHAH